MFNKILGIKDKKKGASDNSTTSTQTDPLVDEDETIVIDLGGHENPHPDDVRIEIDESAPAPEQTPSHTPAPETNSDTPNKPAAILQDISTDFDGDETVIWTGKIDAAEGKTSSPQPDNAPDDPHILSSDQPSSLTVGWLVVSEGDNRGRAFPVRIGRNKVGRGATNAVNIDIGDTAISKDNHITLAADPKTQRFFAIPGDSTNFAYLNGEPLLEAKEIEDKTAMQIGNTSFVFVQFIGHYVDWG